MNATLLKASIAFVPAGMLFAGSVSFFRKGKKSPASVLQLLGAGFLLVIPLTHVCEALRLVPWMQWGLEHSAGHYVDLSGAVVGLTLFPLGYLLQAFSKSRVREPSSPGS